MNKAELINAIAGKTKLTKGKTKDVIDAFMEVTSEALGKGERVALVGFGSFTVVDRKARSGRNPLTGAEIQIGAKKVVKFTPGAELKTKVQ